jgi:peptidoglycan/xylan/chitin deacetylase (PgdA/CDA1 family)
MSLVTLRDLRRRTAPLAKTAMLRGGAYSLVRRLLPSRRVAILRYHSISDDDAWYADAGIRISPAAFEAHAKYLAGHYAVMPLAEIVERLRTRRSMPRNAVAITFDDGYADNLPAARVLNRYGLTATFFIAAGCMVGGDPFWPAEIRALVRAARTPVLLVMAGRTPHTIPVATASEQTRAIRTLTRLFKSHPIPVREAMREQLRRAAGGRAMPDCMLRWDELAEMQRLGMTIGAHTLTHPNLPSAGLEDAAAEIAGSKARLERELGEPVTLFSYPNGGAERYYTPDLQRIVADSGFAAAASSHNAFAGRHSDLFALERIEVEERSADLVFALEIERFAFKPALRPSEVWQ